MQRPCTSPEHKRAAHSRRPAVEFFEIEQSAPLNSGSHTQKTFRRWSTSQRPWPEHATPAAPGQELSAHARPVQPALHTQSPSTHRPCGGEQSLGQTSTAQLAPRQPGSHMHLPRTHLPWLGPEQSAGHVVLAQKGGA